MNKLTCEECTGQFEPFIENDVVYFPKHYIFTSSPYKCSRSNDEADKDIQIKYWQEKEKTYPDWIQRVASELEERLHGTYMWRSKWRAVVSETIYRYSST